MSKNFWVIERKKLLRSVVKEYEEEGYDRKEATNMAKEEVNEIMDQKLGLVHQIWEDTYEE
jgi:hypothetical protein|tara:strand:- start:735 stop:917 length:183 start_codon:yes stop_codon:yes gene_type:complete